MTDIILIVVAALNWILLLAISVLVVLLYRQFGLLYAGSRAQMEARSLEPGMRAPRGLVARDDDGQEVALDWGELGDGRAVALLFTASTDRIGRRLLRQLDRVVEAWDNDAAVVVLKKIDPSHERRIKGLSVPSRHRWKFLSTDTDTIERAFDVTINPLLLVIGADGLVRSKEIVNTVEHVSAQLAYALDDRLSATA